MPTGTSRPPIVLSTRSTFTFGSIVWRTPIGSIAALPCPYGRWMPWSYRCAWIEVVVSAPDGQRQLADHEGVQLRIDGSGQVEVRRRPDRHDHRVVGGEV